MSGNMAGFRPSYKVRLQREFISNPKINFEPSANQMRLALMKEVQFLYERTQADIQKDDPAALRAVETAGVVPKTNFVALNFSEFEKFNKIELNKAEAWPEFAPIPYPLPVYDNVIDFIFSCSEHLTLKDWYNTDMYRGPSEDETCYMVAILTLNFMRFGENREFHYAVSFNKSAPCVGHFETKFVQDDTFDRILVVQTAPYTKTPRVVAIISSLLSGESNPYDIDSLGRRLDSAVSGMWYLKKTPAHYVKVGSKGLYVDPKEGRAEESLTMQDIENQRKKTKGNAVSPGRDDEEPLYEEEDPLPAASPREEEQGRAVSPGRDDEEPLYEEEGPCRRRLSSPRAKRNKAERCRLVAMTRSRSTKRKALPAASLESPREEEQGGAVAPGRDVEEALYEEEDILPAASYRAEPVPTKALEDRPSQPRPLSDLSA